MNLQSVKQKYVKMKSNILFMILNVLKTISRYQMLINIGVLVIGIVFQFGLNSCLIGFIGKARCDYLIVLMSNMASVIGLSTIVVFGFNFSTSISKSWDKKINEHGLIETHVYNFLDIKIGYWQLPLVLLLYLCIAMHMCTLFYVLLIYDAVCFIVLLIKGYAVENAGYDYIIYDYNKSLEGKKEETLKSIVRNCIQDDGQIKRKAVRTYLKLFDKYWHKDNGSGCLSSEKSQLDSLDKYSVIQSFEKLYDRVKTLFETTMNDPVISRENGSYLLLSIIREFCILRENEFNKLEIQIELAVMICYGLNKKNNIDIDYIYKGLLDWIDKSASLRYCIATARIEYLYAVDSGFKRIKVNENLFCLYDYQADNVENYADVIYTLWYLWCDEEKKLTLTYLDKARDFIQLSKMPKYSLSGADNSFYKIIKGLRY